MYYLMEMKHQNEDSLAPRIAKRRVKRINLFILKKKEIKKTLCSLAPYHDWNDNL